MISNKLQVTSYKKNRLPLVACYLLLEVVII